MRRRRVSCFHLVAVPAVEKKKKKMMMNEHGKSHYDVLGVPHHASASAIRAQYLKLVQQYHPDRNPDAAAPHQFKLVAEAYDALRDPGRRAKYDLRVADDRRRGRGRGRHTAGPFSSTASTGAYHAPSRGAGAFNRFKAALQQRRPAAFLLMMVPVAGLIGLGLYVSGSDSSGNALRALRLLRQRAHTSGG